MRAGSRDTSKREKSLLTFSTVLSSTSTSPPACASSTNASICASRAAWTAASRSRSRSLIDFLPRPVEISPFIHSSLKQFDANADAQHRHLVSPERLHVDRREREPSRLRDRGQLDGGARVWRWKQVEAEPQAEPGQ